MGTSKRYAEQIDARMRERLAAEPRRPCTLPLEAYGPETFVWARPGARRAVWAWITWQTGPAERIAATATGWNDRVVCVEWNGPRGTHNTIVWRAAVRNRVAGR